MTTLIDNWYITLGVIAVLVAAGIELYHADKNRVLEWLLGAVVLAEKELGSGTGKLKLRSVYDAFISKFPVFSKIIAFDKFSELVDQALDEMKKIIESNKAVQAFVGVADNGKNDA